MSEPTKADIIRAINQNLLPIPPEPKILEIARTGGERKYSIDLRLMTVDELVDELAGWAFDVWQTQLDTEVPDWYQHYIHDISDLIKQKARGE